jgi:hypothetical protein
VALVDIKEFLELELLPSFKAEAHTFNASLQEEFMVQGTPFLDKNYIALLTQSNMSMKSFKGVCIEMFGTDRFNYVPTPEEDLTLELFDEHYEFGLYPHCRRWVTHFAKKKVFVKRATVLRYIYAS